MSQQARALAASELRVIVPEQQASLPATRDVVDAATRSFLVQGELATLFAVVRFVPGEAAGAHSTGGSSADVSQALRRQAASVQLQHWAAMLDQLVFRVELAVPETTGSVIALAANHVPLPADAVSDPFQRAFMLSDTTAVFRLSMPVSVRASALDQELELRVTMLLQGATFARQHIDAPWSAASLTGRPQQVEGPLERATTAQRRLSSLHAPDRAQKRVVILPVRVVMPWTLDVVDGRVGERSFISIAVRNITSDLTIDVTDIQLHMDQTHVLIPERAAALSPLQSPRSVATAANDADSEPTTAGQTPRLLLAPRSGKGSAMPTPRLTGRPAATPPASVLSPSESVVVSPPAPLEAISGGASGVTSPRSLASSSAAGVGVDADALVPGAVVPADAFRVSSTTAALPTSVRPGEERSYLFDIEDTGHASEAMQRLETTGEYETPFTLSWRVGCINGRVLSQHNARWSLPPMRGLVVSMSSSASQVAVHSVFPVDVMVSNAQSRPVDLSVLVFPDSNDAAPLHEQQQQQQSQQQSPVLTPRSVQTAVPLSPRSGNATKIRDFASAVVAAVGTHASSSGNDNATPTASSRVPLTQLRDKAHFSSFRDLNRLMRTPASSRVSLDTPTSATRPRSQADERDASSRGPGVAAETNLPIAAAAAPDPHRGNVVLAAWAAIEEDEPAVICLEKRLDLGQLAPHSSLGLRLHFIALKEGVYELFPIHFIDHESGRVFQVRSSCQVTVLVS